MRTFLRLLILLAVIVFIPLSSMSENETGLVAKVTTENRGPLKLRAEGSPRSRVLTEIPNGTCIQVLEEDDTWCHILFEETEGYCKTEFLLFFREMDLSILNFRVLKKGDKGDDVLALKKRMKELGYIRGAAQLTDTYTDVTAERVILFQRQTDMTEDGIASQELQAYLFSDQAPACSQALPKVRTRVASQGNENRIICGCCMGEGCECCHFTGWITY